MKTLPRGLVMVMAVVCGLSGCASRPVVEAPPASDVVLAPLVLLKERADGGLMVTHMVKISGRIIRVQGKMPEAKGALDFLADAKALRAGRVTLTTEQADAALAELSRVTSQDVESTPGVQVGAGIPARVVIGPELRYPTGWKKNPAPAGGWLATKIETRSLGISLYVLPQLATDESIQLEATIETTELDGFIERAAPSEKTTSMTEFLAVNEPPKPSVPAVTVNMGPHPVPFFEPVFSVKTVTGTGRIADGATLVLIGDLRRSKGEPDTLLVFLTATAKPVTR